MTSTTTNGISHHAEGVAHAPTSAGRRRVVEYSDLVARLAELGAEREWIVEGAIERSPIVVLAGPEKRGKSWILADLVRAIATGGKWIGAFESRVEGDVLVLEDEYGPHEYARRLARLARGTGVDPEVVLRRTRHYWSGPPVTLDDQCEVVKRLARDVKEHPVAAIVIDPLRNYLPAGTSENDAAAVVRALGVVSWLRDRAECPVVIAHHLNRAGTMSGSRAIRTRADVFVEGTDEDVPWYSAVGRTIRTRDAIARKFLVEVVHEHDDDDRVATTRLRCRFEGEKRSRESLSQTARKLLDALRAADEPMTARRLRDQTKTNGGVCTRGLDELRSAGLVAVEDGKWRVSTRESWREMREHIAAAEREEGDQDAAQPF